METTTDQAAASGNNGRFYAFNLRQVLLLFALLCVLLGILTPRIRRTIERQRFEERGDRKAALNAALATAIRANDATAARQALAEGADANVWINSPPGRASGTCVDKGQVEMMELLLDHGAGVEQVERAIRSQQPPEVRGRMIRLLVSRGANPPKEAAMDLAFNISDAQTVDLLREYGAPYGPREMVGLNRLDELKRAVEQNPDIVKDRFRPQWAGRYPTLLAIALERGNREMALFLIEAGSPLDTIVSEGSTLLHMAAKGGDPELIRLLLARGLDVDATDNYSDTPLCDIASRELPRAVAVLLEAGANVNHHGMNQRTPLHGAVWSNHVEVVRMLLEAGADPMLGDYQGKTPLEMARGKRPEILKLLEEAVAKRAASSEPVP